MYGFERAMQEYERHLTAPYDEGGALYSEDEDTLTREDYMEMQAEMLMDEMECENN